MHFLKCLVIGIAVAAGVIGGFWGGIRAIEAVDNWLVAKFGYRTAGTILSVTAVFIGITVAVTIACYFASATHN